VAAVAELGPLGNMKRIFYMFSLLLALVGCGPKTTAEGDPINKSAEDFLKHIEAYPPSGASFRLALSDSFTFMGKGDASGAGTALVVAELVRRGYVPDGQPEQKSGYRVIQFKKTQ
jgi:hypothetical protein